MSDYLREPWLARFLKWLAQYMLGWTWIWQKILFPVFRRVFSVYKSVSSVYMKIWKKLVYKNGSFGRARAGLTIIATCVFVWLIPNLLFIGYQTAMFGATARMNEAIYLTNSQEIDPEDNVHSIKGCTALPCTEENAVYYRVRTTSFHQLYSILTKGSMFYPDLTASVVAPGYNECIVDSYGIRFKTLMRTYDIYPDMLDAICKPIVSDK